MKELYLLVLLVSAHYNNSCLLAMFPFVTFFPTMYSENTPYSTKLFFKVALHQHTNFIASSRHYCFVREVSKQLFNLKIYNATVLTA